MAVDEATIRVATARFTPEVINRQKCLARTWAGGDGGQCQKKKDAGDFCKQHCTGDVWKVHGRVDGGIPSKKLAEFIATASKKSIGGAGGELAGSGLSESSGAMSAKAEVSHSSPSSSSTETPGCLAQRRKRVEDFSDCSKRAKQEVVIIEDDRVMIATRTWAAIARIAAEQTAAEDKEAEDQKVTQEKAIEEATRKAAADEAAAVKKAAEEQAAEEEKKAAEDARVAAEKKAAKEKDAAEKKALTEKAAEEAARKAAAFEPHHKNVQQTLNNLPMDIPHFIAFCQCSIKMEAQKYLNCNTLELKDPLAIQMWPQFEKMALQNSSGKMDKWVPYHTVLGPHSQFVVKNVYTRKDKLWTDARCLVINFVFRAHCRPEVFEVQRPILSSKTFWQDPVAGFNVNSPMHKALRDFRAKGNALQTSAFRIIPERIVKDTDENLVRNLLLRSQRLIGLAQNLLRIAMDNKTSTLQKYLNMVSAIENVPRLGPTWVKMLMVEIDIAIPRIGLLQDRCEVGSGAEGPLKKILHNEGIVSVGLQTLKNLRNLIDKYIGSASGNHFKNLLCEFETDARKHFEAVPMILQQMDTSGRPLSCSTLQVQLCEFRQLGELMEQDLTSVR